MSCMCTAWKLDLGRCTCAWLRGQAGDTQHAAQLRKVLQTVRACPFDKYLVPAINDNINSLLKEVLPQPLPPPEIAPSCLWHMLCLAYTGALTTCKQRVHEGTCIPLVKMPCSLFACTHALSACGIVMQVGGMLN